MRPPATLKLNQALVAGFGAPEIDALKTTLVIMLDSFPENEIVAAVGIELSIRGAELKNCMPSKMEENSRGHRLAPITRNKYVPLLACDNMLEYGPEKMPWLRRQTMAFACQAVKAVEDANRFDRRRNAYNNA